MKIPMKNHKGAPIDGMMIEDNKDIPLYICEDKDGTAVYDLSGETPMWLGTTLGGEAFWSPANYFKEPQAYKVGPFSAKEAIVYLAGNLRWTFQQRIYMIDALLAHLLR